MNPFNRIHQRISNERGLSMLEVLFAVVLLSGGILAYARFTAGVVDRNDTNAKRSTAMTYAQEKIEDLKNEANNSTLDNTDNGNDTLEGIYTRAWTITNGGADSLATLTVTVTWPDQPTNQSVTLITLLYQS